MNIKTDSTPLEEPKDFNNCIVYKLYSFLASQKEIDVMQGNYKNGNYGYGHAKQELFELIVNNFSDQREKYNNLMNDLAYLDSELMRGADKAKNIAQSVLKRVRKKIGY